MPYINDYDKYNNNNIYVVKLTGEDVKIGSDETNDIIDSEPTVSTYHGILKFKKENGFVTITNKGKIWILVLINNNLKIEIVQTIYFQIGNIYIKAEVSKDKDKVLKKENNNYSNQTTEKTRNF